MQALETAVSMFNESIDVVKMFNVVIKTLNLLLPIFSIFWQPLTHCVVHWQEEKATHRAWVPPRAHHVGRRLGQHVQSVGGHGRGHA